MMSSPELVAHAEQPAYRRIFEGLLAQITNDKLPPGTQLPPTRELAVTWKSNFFTVHTALSALAKEGWLDRRPGSGTFIADPKNRFSCAGIYHAVDVVNYTQSSYSRSVHFSLIRAFEQMKKDTLVFFDSRPPPQQRKILPALADAILNRRIQCLVAPTVGPDNAPSLGRLSMPTAFSKDAFSAHYVDLDMRSMFHETLRRMKTRGCRSIAVMCHMDIDEGYYDWGARDFIRHFETAVRDAGFTMRPEWVRIPNHGIADLESYGYHAFKEFWRLPEKPDALFVFPDLVARGAILSILETGRDEVMSKLKLAFHRNRELPIFCPFPATWAITDEAAVARGFIELIQQQFRREKPMPYLVPFAFEETTGEYVS